MDNLYILTQAPAFLFGYGLGVLIGATCLYMALTSSYKLNVRDEKLRNLNVTKEY